MRALWDGLSGFHGPHYDYEIDHEPDRASIVNPARGRVPVWVVAVWPRPRSMRRALGCDGVVPQYSLDGRDAGPEDAREVRAFLDGNGASHLELIAQAKRPPTTPWSTRPRRTVGGRRLRLVARDSLGGAEPQP